MTYHQLILKCNQLGYIFSANLSAKKRYNVISSQYMFYA